MRAEKDLIESAILILICQSKFFCLEGEFEAHNGQHKAALDSQHSLFSMENIADVSVVNRGHCLEESGQWLENAD